MPYLKKHPGPRPVGQFEKFRDNWTSFTPHRREGVSLALEYADRELGGKIKSFTVPIRR